MRTSWKWIRIYDNTYDDLKELGHFGESFNDIIQRLMAKEGRSAEGTRTVVGPDEMFARLKKFNSHAKAIAKLVKENVSYTNDDNITRH